MKTDQSGGIIIGAIFFAIVGLVAVLLVAVVIPSISEQNLNQLKQNDIDSIKRTITGYITKTDTIPKSWDDIPQISFEHYQDNQIIANLNPEAGFEATKKWANSALNDGFDHVGVFVQTRCETDSGETTVAPGSDDQIAILFERGSELICQQFTSPETNPVNHQ